MIIDVKNVNKVGEEVTLATPPRKRSKKQEKKKSKRSRIEEIPVENSENTEVGNEQTLESVQEITESPSSPEIHQLSGYVFEDGVVHRSEVQHLLGAIWKSQAAYADLSSY